MSTMRSISVRSLDVVVTDTAPGADTSDSIEDPGRRGGLSIADKVVIRIASQAVTEVRAVVESGTGMLDKMVGRKLPKTSAEVRGDLVWLQVETAAEWPTPLGELVQEVRAAVTSAVESMTGLQVKVVDVTVSRIERPSRPTVRRVS